MECDNASLVSKAAVGRGMGDCEVLETHELLDIHERNLAGRAVALLAHDHLYHAFLLARLVVLGPVQQKYRIGILLDGAGFAQVGQARAMVLAIFRTAVNLGESDDRNLELTREKLES